MRALPAFSLANLGEIAVGNSGAPAAAGAVGAAAVGAAPDGAAAAGVAPAPHSALRKSFHFLSPSVPAALAALYWALHSADVRPLAASVAGAVAAGAGAAAEGVAAAFAAGG